MREAAAVCFAFFLMSPPCHARARFTRAAFRHASLREIQPEAYARPFLKASRAARASDDIILR